MKPYGITLLPEHIPLASTLLKEMNETLLPAVDKATTKEEWNKAMEACHERTRAFWKTMEEFYPIKEMACGLGTNHSGEIFIWVECTMEEKRKQLQYMKPQALVSEVGKRVAGGIRKGYV